MRVSQRALLLGGTVWCSFFQDASIAQQSTAQTGAPPGLTGGSLAPRAEGPTNAAVEDIIVTGTLIKGFAPVGTQVIGISTADIKATGVASPRDLLAKVPQIANFFNQIPATGTDFGQVNTSPSLRNLGGGTTLFLVDGHRVTPYGAISDVPDPDIIPTAVLERVEVVPDGGSSIYGSDGIAGVINYITRRSIDGVIATGHYGFADAYHTWDASVAGGTKFAGGSVYLAYTHSQHDSISRRDRDYARQYPSFFGRTCAPGNIQIGSTYYSATTFTQPGSLCDIQIDAALYPAEKRDSVFAGASFDTDHVKFDIRAYYTHRTARSFTQQRMSTAAITSENPFFRQIGAESSQTVLLSYAPVFGPSAGTFANIYQAGVAPSFEAELGTTWRLKGQAYAGRSNSTNHNPQLNLNLQSAALASPSIASALNPYNLAATNSAVLQGIGNYEQFGHSIQKLATARLVLDGSLLTLPSGDVRAALGTEYIYQLYNAIAGNIVIGDTSSASLGRGRDHRSIYALFGEVVVPVVGAGNAMPGIQQLLLSASGRYDHYNSFGSTFNPKFSVTYKPFSSLSLRANYSKAFNAPLLQDTGAPDTRATQFAPQLRPGDDPSNLQRPTLILAGGDPNLKPQRARIWTVGADFTPVFAPGLTLSTTYYNINFRDQITIAFPFTDPDYYTNRPGYYIVNPTLAQAQGFIGNLKPDNFNLANLYATGQSPYLLFDFRRHNFGKIRQRGLDFSAAYEHPTNFGSVNASIGGTYILKRLSQLAPASPWTDTLLANTSRLSLSSTLGFSAGNFSSRATLLHSQGYEVTGALAQTRIKSFNTLNLFASYDLKGSGMFRDLSVTINIDNVIDQDPPTLNNATGFGNGGTLGRLVQLGISKNF